MLSESFFSKLTDMCSDLGMNPRDLLLVMFSESGVNPAAINRNGNAIGLIQFMPDTLRGMGVPENQINTFGQKSPENQLDYVKQYIKGKESIMGGKPFTSATQYYHANYFPKTLSRWKGSDPIRNRNVIVTSKYAKSQQERAAYKANKILDTNNDGYITVGDLTTILSRMAQKPQFKQMIAKLNNVAGDGQVSEYYAFKKYRQSRQPDQLSHKESDGDSGSVGSFILSKLEQFLNAILASQNNDLIKISILNERADIFQHGVEIFTKDLNGTGG